MGQVKAPEKLYITNDETRFSDKCHSASTEKYVDDDIEYTRTDVFIKKAYEFLNKYISEIEQYEPAIMDYEVIDVHCKHYDSKKDFIEDFKKYIED